MSTCEQRYGLIGFVANLQVGLLTRQILVQGDATSDTAGLGAHMMFLEGSTVRLSGIEVTKAGQLSVLGRYPIHWHTAKQMAAGQAVISDSSIHHCYQRCVTIHDTHGTSSGKIVLTS